MQKFSQNHGARVVLQVWIAVLGVAAWVALAAQPGEERASEAQDPGSRANPIRFQNLTNVDGLSQVSALAIAQDRKGFVWIGTEDGLNRYDGTGFRVLRHRPGDPESSLLGGAIQVLHSDRSGSLWIGMRTGGFSRFDPSTEQFTHYLQGAADLDLSHYEISGIHEDRSGVLWIGSRGGGLLRLDPSTGALTHLRHDGDDPHSLGLDVVEAVAETAGGLWIGTDGGGLDRLDVSAGTFTHYRHDPGDPASPARDRIRALHTTRAGIVWIGTEGGGLLRFEPRVERFTHVPTGEDPRGQLIWVLHGDRSGVLWIGTPRGGLLRLDPSTERLTPYRHDPDDPGSLRSNDIRSIFEDRFGNIWVGTWSQGVHRFHPDEEPFLNYQHDPGDPRSLSEGIVMAIHEDRSGVLWVGTTGGLNRRDPTGGGFTRYLADPEDPRALHDHQVLALHEDRSGNLWVGVPGTVYRLDPSRRDFTAYPFDPEAAGSQAGSSSMDVHEDRSGNLWIGTYKGLGRLDPATGAYVHHGHDPDDPGTLSHPYVTSLAEDRSGALWIGTLGGLNRLDPSGPPFHRYLSDPGDPRSLRNDQVLHVFEDSSGVLWVGTFGGGLLRFEATTQGFFSYTEADGLPNNVVWAIAEDDLGRLWISTTRGLARFEPEAERFTAYDPADGILDYEFNLGARFRGSDGWMYFGNVRGVDAFRPERFRDNPEPPPVVLTSFRIFQEEADLVTAAPYLEEIELSHRENFFSFDFAALNFRRPDKNRYVFMLEGVDEDWVDGGTRPFASYTKVSPGAYVFRVRASNNDGVWNDEGISLRVTIRPPLWATWWAYALYALAAVAVVAGYVQAQRGKIAREQAVVKRLREVDRLKDEFLANTSHELRTPLHGMTGLAESLVDGARGELPPVAREDLGMIVTSGRRLTGLVNDILDFSKLRHEGLELRRRPVDLRSLTEVVLALSRPLASDKELELRNAVPADLPPADADEDRLQQILHNLVGNAVKFTEEGSVEVTASIQGGKLVVRVVDTGIGVAAEARSRIFDAFEQVEASAERTYGGTGLGLAISRRLVELHGGRIWLEPGPEQGSAFCFSLSVFRGEASPAVETGRQVAVLEAASEEPVTALAAPRRASGERLLIVDDEPVNRQVLINHLKLADYRLQTAANGHEALQLLEEQSFDLVLLDVMMPKMSGYEVCSKIRERHSVQELPVIFLTARSQVADLVSGFAAGANDYLTKPISKNELMARVRSHLDLLRLHHSMETLVEERSSEIERRERLIGKLERLIAEVEHINYTFSHDLKTPLVTIKNFIGMVKGYAAQGDAENVNKGLDHIDSAAEQMRMLLDELIRYSRVGREVHEPQEVALAELAQVARERLRGALEERGFQVVVARGLPRVLGDPALLLVVFQSLFENAVHYVGEVKAPRLEVDWRRDGEEEVTFVRDNGAGIAAAYHEKIFGLFDRLATEPPGTGVGLALARRIVEAHGGRIWVESEGPGTGSTFCFTLPATVGPHDPG